MAEATGSDPSSWRNWTPVSPYLAKDPRPDLTQGMSLSTVELIEQKASEAPKRRPATVQNSVTNVERVVETSVETLGRVSRSIVSQIYRKLRKRDPSMLCLENETRTLVGDRRKRRRSRRSGSRGSRRRLRKKPSPRSNARTATPSPRSARRRSASRRPSPRPTTTRVIPDRFVFSVLARNETRPSLSRNAAARGSSFCARCRRRQTRPSQAEAKEAEEKCKSAYDACKKAREDARAEAEQGANAE